MLSLRHKKLCYLFLQRLDTIGLKFLGLRFCFAHRDEGSCSEMQRLLVIPQLELLKWGAILEPSLDFMVATLIASLVDLVT